MTGVINDSSLRDLNMRYNNEQEMQCEDSTIDDTGIQPTLYSTMSSDWTGQQSSYSSSASYSKSHSKGSKKVKSEDADEDIDIDNFVQQDVQRIPVKTLRKVIPKLRIAVYCSDVMTSGKRKLKHLWDERPGDWPSSIPFKDPNNACKDVKKPGKDELGPMFNFLKAKYLEIQIGLHQSATADAPESDYSYSHPVVAESSTDKESTFFYSSISNNPILPQIRYEAQPTDQSQYLISPKSEPSSAYVEIGELMNQDVKHATFAMTPQLVSMSRPVAVASKPQPVMDLYGRLDKKYKEVVALSQQDNRQSVMQVLLEVEHAVIKKLFDDITPNDTRICLMFLDAGHQMEALLDVMLVLGQVDILLLQNGCQEIIKKFNTQNVNFVLFPQPSPLLSKRDPLLPSSVGSFKGDSDMLSDDMSDDGKMDDNILCDLGIDLYSRGKHKADVESGNLDSASHVQLFKPRRGAEGVQEDSGMGIQTRSVQPSSPDSDDSKSSFGVVPVKGMHVMEIESPSPRLSEQDKLYMILKDLQDSDYEMRKMMNQFLDESGTASNVHAYKEQCMMDRDAMLEDIDTIINEERQGEFRSQRQETGGGQNYQSSQLVPSSAIGIIPAMVEDLSCADSESEDSDSSIPSNAPRFGGGSAFGGNICGGRVFESFSQWMPGNQC